MRALRIAAIALLAWAGIVVAFESLIGVIQPTAGSTMVITTYDPDGTAHERVVSRLEHQGHLYVAANHWPRAWYERALAHPEVRVALDGQESERRAVAVEGAERDRVDAAHSLGPIFRFLTGFPPRHLLRLDPR